MALFGKYALCLGIVAGTASFNFIERDKVPSSTEVEKQSNDADSQQQNHVCISPVTCPEKDCDKVVDSKSEKCDRAICLDCLELSKAEKNTAVQ